MEYYEHQPHTIAFFISRQHRGHKPLGEFSRQVSSKLVHAFNGHYFPTFCRPFWPCGYKKLIASLQIAAIWCSHTVFALPDSLEPRVGRVFGRAMHTTPPHFSVPSIKSYKEAKMSATIQPRLGEQNDQNRQTHIDTSKPALKLPTS